jgi:ABC-type multidrug transport system permease subunit
MDKDKEKQEISLIGRLFSLEVLLILMGLFTLISGIIYGQMPRILWGVIIIGISLLLPFIRKKECKNK